jgi:hypothetical protein
MLLTEYNTRLLLLHMIITNSKVILLFIEPKNGKSVLPVNDAETLFMEKLLTDATNDNLKSGVVMPNGIFVRGLSTKGLHQCVCGEYSHSRDYEIYDGIHTNSLATHYLRWHRGEIPETELDKIKFLMKKIIV